jgi:hypothetical protein
MKRTNDYARLIAEFGYLCEAKTIVEIGVNAGDTTLELCEAAKHTGGKVIGVDMWDRHGLFDQFAQSGDFSRVKSRLEKAGYNNFELYKKNTYDKDFPEFLKEKTGGEIDLAFIDGDHSYIGCLNDMQAVYPILSKTGIVVFHDTQRIDGCREFIYDLRTKYFDGTYDIIDLGSGYGRAKMGISFLVKRQFPLLQIPINQLCGSPNTAEVIEQKEFAWYDEELQKREGYVDLMSVRVDEIKLARVDNFRPKGREYGK